MAYRNTAKTYGSVTKTFHWLTALLILTAFPLGILAHDAPFETSDELAFKALLFSWHKTVGVTAFFVASLRILWALTQEKPGLLNAEHKLEAFAAETVHWVLYGCMVLVPLTGWIHHAAAEGFAPIWWPFGQSLPFIPKDAQLSEVFGAIHTTLTPVLAISILAHVGGALKHAFVDRDKTLSRMMPGTGDMPTPPAQNHSRLPMIVAIFIWAVAMTIGTMSAKTTDQNQSAALATVQSDWTVESGELAITIRQLGSDVRGSFANWTADISFEEVPTDGRHGDVEVTIAIDSLSLGSVTQQAMGGDYFNANDFPTSVFSADILGSESGYIAEGTLTLKGVAVPVSLPFDLTIAGDQATMTGQLTLDRLAFGIGENMPDESSLGFAVIVDVNLIANR